MNTIDTKALREKILDLAMRGKLVPQDPSDEPASVLLENIKQEKEQLIKDKVIKKQKALPPIEKSEEPFDIPSSWEWVRLGELCQLVTKGTTPKGGKDAYYSYGINFYRAENINFNINHKNIVYISKSQHENELRRSQLKENDFLITIAGTLGRCAIVRNKDLPGNTNQAICIARFINPDLVNLSFFKFYFSSNLCLSILLSKTKVTSIPNLTLNIISNSFIPLPPLNEQQRIVEKIEALFAELDKIDEAQEQYNSAANKLREKVLDTAMRGKLVPQDPSDEPASELLKQIEDEKQKLIEQKVIKKQKALPPIKKDEEPFEIPESWEWVRLGEICQLVTKGLNRSSKFQDINNEYQYLKMNNITNWTGQLTWDKITKVNATTEEVSKYSLNINDWLINTVNSKELVGKSAVIKKDYSHPILFNNNILKLKAFNDINISYINYFWICPINRLNLWKKSTQSTNLASISNSNLSIFLIPLPPLKEQQRIVKKIEETLKSLEMNS